MYRYEYRYKLYTETVVCNDFTLLSVRVFNHFCYLPTPSASPSWWLHDSFLAWMVTFSFTTARTTKMGGGRCSNIVIQHPFNPQPLLHARVRPRDTTTVVTALPLFLSSPCQQLDSMGGVLFLPPTRTTRREASTLLSERTSDHKKTIASTKVQQHQKVTATGLL